MIAFTGILSVCNIQRSLLKWSLPGAGIVIPACVGIQIFFNLRLVHSSVHDEKNNCGQDHGAAQNLAHGEF